MFFLRSTFEDSHPGAEHCACCFFCVRQMFLFRSTRGPGCRRQSLDFEGFRGDSCVNRRGNLRISTNRLFCFSSQIERNPRRLAVCIRMFLISAIVLFLSNNRTKSQRGAGRQTTCQIPVALVGSEGWGAPRPTGRSFFLGVRGRDVDAAAGSGVGSGTPGCRLHQRLASKMLL